MSFGFGAVKEHWQGMPDAPIRELLECGLFDVSIVTYLAYMNTSVGVRSQEIYDSYAAAVQANSSG
ncbi:MAG: phage prohead protease HK97 family [Bacillota bacterium]|nr:MAG: phage prohead protease HK97 family [Bacillota bacterium]MBS3949946.1 HK97 family phage prohead protease [Peptococcaceae bacterium]